MKNIWPMATLFLLLLAASHPAAAMSTETGAAQNSDGTPKFADPDEQMPAFMTAPAIQPGRAVAGAGFNDSAVTPPVSGDNDGGALAFDRAFSHQQDKQ